MLESVRIADRPISQPVLHAALDGGYTDVQSRVIAGRLGDRDAKRVGSLVRPRLADLDPPDRLPDIGIAADTVARAVMQGLPLIILSDFDCDGASGHAVVKFALRDYFGVPTSRIHSYIGLRLRDGYGVSEGVTDRILASAPRPAVIITVDQGSTDQARIEKLRRHGLMTIVTDHHEVPDCGPPAAAIACVNPVRADSLFGDPCIAGVYVAWLLCCAVRQRLILTGYLPPSTPRLGELLDLVALGTMTDCVDLARSSNNRAVLTRGIALMNAANARPAWRALYRASHCSGPITGETLGFTFGPAINARGRLRSALGAVDLLMCQDDADAVHLAETLLEHNRDRKGIQAQMLQRIRPLAAQQVRDGCAAITVFDSQGHPGVHGICAARLAESFGRPVACFSPKQDGGALTASLRTVPGFHIQHALAEIAGRYPADFIAWGGHAGAGGATLKRAGLARFTATFDAVARRTMTRDQLGPRILTDGELAMPPSFDLFDELAALEPFGRQWDRPVFRGSGRILDLRQVGDGSHLKLRLDLGAETFDAIWFNAVRDGVCPIKAGQAVSVVFELGINRYRDQMHLQLVVRHAVAGQTATL